MTYSELARKYPQLKQLFDASSLTVFAVQTDETDLIDEMFSRLNEAVPLNAAEKRNAFGGPLPKIVKDIAAVPFFKKNLKISNKRYQHRDLAAKMLYLTYSRKVVDTKKVYLDSFFKTNKTTTEAAFKTPIRSVRSILSSMHSTFTVGDKLLRSSGMVIVYYLLFEIAQREKWTHSPTRTSLVSFEARRQANREKAEQDIATANYDLLEFDRLTQTPNDAYAIKFRLDLLKKYTKDKT